jgi:hypothetical protein
LRERTPGISTRILRAPDDGNGAAAAKTDGGDAAAAGAGDQGSSQAPAPSSEAVASPPSALSQAASSNRDGAPNGEAKGATESAGGDAGNRINTTLGNAKYVLEQFGGSKAEQDRLMASLDRSGISHNRDFVALLHRMFERYREPEPVSPNLPSVQTNEPGQRNWYATLDVPKA